MPQTEVDPPAETTDYPTDPVQADNAEPTGVQEESVLAGRSKRVRVKVRISKQYYLKINGHIK